MRASRSHDQPVRGITVKGSGKRISREDDVHIQRKDRYHSGIGGARKPLRKWNRKSEALPRVQHLRFPQAYRGYVELMPYGSAVEGLPLATLKR